MPTTCRRKPIQNEEDSSLPSQYRNIDDFFEEAYTTPIITPSSSTYRNSRRYYWMSILSMGIANSSDATEILCISYILSDESFESNMLRGDIEWRGGLLAGSVFLGMFIGGLFVGTIGDEMGRKPTLLFGLILNAISGIISSIAPNILILSLLRFVCGLGIGATVPSLFTLATELSPPSKRGLFVTLVAGFWMVGSIFVAVLALLCFEFWNVSWRVFALLCAIPSALGAIMIFGWTPESPRFLALKGRHEEAVTVANDVADAMGYPGDRPLSLAEVERFYGNGVGGTTRTDETSFANDGGGGEISSSSREFVKSVGKLYTRGLRRTTIPLQIVWASLSFGSYGLLTWINTIFVAIHLQNVYFNALLFALANLPGNIISALLVDRIGRLPLLTWSMILSAVSLACFAAYVSGDNTSHYTTQIVLSACAFQTFSICGWNTIDCMTGELFPTQVRSTGMGVCTASARIGAVVAQIVNGMLVSRPPVLLSVASVTLLVGAVTPKMLGREDMAQCPLEDGVEKDRCSDGEVENGDLSLCDKHRSCYELVDVK